MPSRNATISIAVTYAGLGLLVLAWLWVGKMLHDRGAAATMPAYDPLTTPSRGVGRATRGRTCPGRGRCRSGRAQTSFAAVGPGAAVRSSPGTRRTAGAVALAVRCADRVVHPWYVLVRGCIAARRHRAHCPRYRRALLAGLERCSRWSATHRADFNFRAFASVTGSRSSRRW